MDVEAGLTTAAPVSSVLAHVDDLSAYPSWMSLVHSAIREEGEQPPTWNVELRASVGPLARSKRLRLVRSEYATIGDVHRVVFERRETDGRMHAMWRLTVTVTEAAGRTSLNMHLHYDGRFFVGVVESILRQHIEAGRARLSELLAAND
jgi:hypothetical protein